jgi:hypothetical protein
VGKKKKTHMDRGKEINLAADVCQKNKCKKPGGGLRL